MAARKKAPAKKAAPRAKKGGAKKGTKSSGAKNQVWAIVLFACGVLVFFLTLIEGANLWSATRNILFGLFSVAAYGIAPLLIYIAVMLALDRPFGSIGGKLLQGFILITLVCSLIHIIIDGQIEGTNFFDQLYRLYESSVAFRSGGLVTALAGWPLIALCGSVGAGIILALLIFVFIMLLSGITLRDVFQFFAKPAKKISETYTEQLEQRKNEAKKPKFNIDVPVEDAPLPEHPVQVFLDPLPEAQRAEVKADLSEIIRAFTPEGEPVEPGGTAQEPAAAAKPEAAAQSESAAKSSSDAPLLEPVKTESGMYRFPPLSLLKRDRPSADPGAARELEDNANKLVETLKSFGVSTSVSNVSRGPSVTRYELQPAAGVKISRITNLADDIALNLAAAGVRIEAPIPNKSAVGIEVPNKITSMVHLGELVSSQAFKMAKSKLTIALGKDIAGNLSLADINKMPHVLIAGATGSGKSVCINSIIMSLLYKASPNDVRLLMIDPKVVELGVYNGIPHLLVPVVTDPRKAAGALNWAVSEMLGRYKLFAEKNVRDLGGYNRLARQSEDMSSLPQIVIIIDELADLMMAAPNEVEDAICRLAQMARAAGMHLVIATQRPSVDVITGVIKANIPSRIAFAVSSQVDSRTILDGGGAEKLLGKGDMLFYPVGAPKPVRLQGCFVTDSEVESVIEFINSTDSSEYDAHIMEEIEKMKAVEKGKKTELTDSAELDDNDPMLLKAIECVVESGQASTSLLQRRLKLGYARAARIVDLMEERGVVGPFEGSKPRKVLISKQQLTEMMMNGAGSPSGQ